MKREREEEETASQRQQYIFICMTTKQHPGLE